MTDSYNPVKKSGLFDPFQENVEGNESPFVIDWSVMQDYWSCVRCTYLKYNHHHGLIAPPLKMPTGFYVEFDQLMRKFFDLYREDMTAERLKELMPNYRGLVPDLIEHSVEANKKEFMENKVGKELLPVGLEMLERWRDVSQISEKTHLRVSACVDDLWRDQNNGQLHVVNYTVVPESGEEVGVANYWQKLNRRKLNFEHYVLKNVGLENLSDSVLQVNAKANLAVSDVEGMKVLFDLEVLPYESDDVQIETAIIRVRKILNSIRIPKASRACHLCEYSRERGVDVRDANLNKQLKAFGSVLDSLTKKVRSRAGEVAGTVGHSIGGARDKITSRLHKRHEK